MCFNTSEHTSGSYSMKSGAVVYTETLTNNCIIADSLRGFPIPGELEDDG